MCPSDPSNKLTLEIKASDSATEIFVINGDLHLEDRGLGTLKTKPLDPGIYKIKTRAGFQTREQHVILRDPGQKLVIPPLAFASPVPLNDTAITHEYLQAAAEAESRVVHVTAGQGSSIFVFSREWTPSPPKPDVQRSSNPARGLSILNAQGNPVAHLETASRLDNQVADPWAACNMKLNPGIFRVSLELSSGHRLEQTLVACSGWQTQVFLSQRNYGSDPDSRCADLAKASILMARGMGFSAGDPGLRQAELARLGLSNERKVLSAEVRQLLRDKLDNPMLGIYGGHLLLLDRSPDLGLLTVVVGNLRGLLGSDHPDVEALALASGIGSSYIFVAPPMLKRSWNLVVDATVQRPNLVPADSQAAKAALNLWSEEPWLLWTEAAPADPARPADAPAAPETTTVSDLEAAFRAHMFALPQRPMSANSPFAAVRKMRSEMRPAGAQDVPLEFAAPQIKQPQVDESKIGFLVSTLGIPRTSIESMLKEMIPKGNESAGYNSRVNGNRWCFAWPAARQSVSGKDRATLVKASRWNSGDIIGISFLEGDPDVQDKVKAAALTWTGPQLARLTLDFRKDTTDTLIRISFQYQGSWSVIGKTCMQISDKTQPTMNFGWLTPASTDEEIRRVVLHEFGHALGLIHEHESPAGGIKWNRNAVIRDLSGAPNNWPLDVIEHNMFEAYAVQETNFTEMDPQSIMMYPIPSSWTLDGFSVGLNGDLSPTDKRFIREQYS